MNVLGVPIGYGAGTAMASVGQVRDAARGAAGAGFDSFWVSQAFGVDPIVALAAIAADVPQFAELGTSVVPLAGRHPLALAAQARTAQSALHGRFTLGIGPSHRTVVEGFFGESYERPFTRTVEFLDALVPLLRGEPADVTGEQLAVHGWLTIDADPCPVLLGPRSSHARARRTADGRHDRRLVRTSHHRLACRADHHCRRRRPPRPEDHGARVRRRHR